MIFGQTYQTEREQQIARLRKELQGEWVFAWWPVKIKTGQRAWLQFVWRFKAHIPPGSHGSSVYNYWWITWDGGWEYYTAKPIPHPREEYLEDALKD